MEIITATDAHISEIVELWKELADYHGELDSFFRRKEDGHIFFGKRIKELIYSKDSLVLVALDRDDVMAFSTAFINKYPPVYQNEIHGYIGSLTVKSNCRRKGIGEKMLAKIFSWFESQDIHRVELRVRVRNEWGYSFWKKHGFQDYEHTVYRDITQIQRVKDTV